MRNGVRYKYPKSTCHSTQSLPDPIPSIHPYLFPNPLVSPHTQPFKSLLIPPPKNSEPFAARELSHINFSQNKKEGGERSENLSPSLFLKIFFFCLFLPYPAYKPKPSISKPLSYTYMKKSSRHIFQS